MQIGFNVSCSKPVQPERVAAIRVARGFMEPFSPGKVRSSNLFFSGACCLCLFSSVAGSPLHMVNSQTKWWPSHFGVAGCWGFEVSVERTHGPLASAEELPSGALTFHLEPDVMSPFAPRMGQAGV